MREKYAGQLVAEGVLTSDEADALATAAYQRLVEIQQAFKASTGKSTTPETRKQVVAGQEVDTRVAAELLSALNDQLLTYPADFTVNPKLAKQLERRRPALGPGRRHRLGPCRGARAREPAHGRRAAALHRAGCRARHLQPAPAGAARREHRCHLVSAAAAAGLHGPVRAAQQPAFGTGDARASSTATAPRPPTRWCCGKRSSATSSTAPR